METDSFSNSNWSTTYYEDDFHILEECNSTDPLASNNIFYAFGLTAKICLLICFFLIALLSVFGNGLVIILVCVNKSLRTGSHVFIVSHAIAGLLYCVHVAHFNFGDILNYQGWVNRLLICKLSYFHTAAFSIAIFFTLVCFSFDRYRAVFRPSGQKPSVKFCLLVSLGIWLGAFVLAIPFVICRREYFNKWTSKCECSLAPECYTFMSIYGTGALIDILQFAIPVIVMGVLYGMICCRICRRDNTDSRLQGKKQSVQMFLTITLLHVFLWLPSKFSRFVRWDHFVIAYVVTALTPIITPIIYFAMNPKFRKACLCRR